jgi:hypothetical protein
MKNLSVNHVPDFAKQKQELALRFRDSAHSRGGIRDRTLRDAAENQQNNMSLNFSEEPDHLLSSQWIWGDGQIF